MQAAAYRALGEVLATAYRWRIASKQIRTLTAPAGLAARLL